MSMFFGELDDDYWEYVREKEERIQKWLDTSSSNIFQQFSKNFYRNFFYKAPYFQTQQQIEDAKYHGELYTDNYRHGKQWFRRTKTKFDLVANDEFETIELTSLIEEGKEVFYLNGAKLYEIVSNKGEFAST